MTYKANPDVEILWELEQGSGTTIEEIECENQ